MMLLRNNIKLLSSGLKLLPRASIPVQRFNFATSADTHENKTIPSINDEALKYAGGDLLKKFKDEHAHKLVDVSKVLVIDLAVYLLGKLVNSIIQGHKLLRH